MATQEMTGTNKLAERIINDAHADALKISGEAQKSIETIRAESKKQLADQMADDAGKRAAAVASVLDGCRTRTALDGRKSTLRKKRVVIDETFQRAYEALLALDAEKRGQICLNILAREAEDGEIVVPAAKDRAVIERMLADYKKNALKLSADNADIDGGFLLMHKGYEKNCSFSSLLSELREQEETNVANLLFNSEGGES
ncbi:MAG: V-type ATP synthase subunit E family protein [Clostridia bacterium]